MRSNINRLKCLLLPYLASSHLILLSTALILADVEHDHQEVAVAAWKNQVSLRGTPASIYRNAWNQPLSLLGVTSSLIMSVPIPKAYMFPVDVGLDYGTYYFVWIAGVHQIAWDINLSQPSSAFFVTYEEFTAWKSNKHDPLYLTPQNPDHFCASCTHWRFESDVDPSTRWYLVIINTQARRAPLRARGVVLAHGNTDNSVHRLVHGADSVLITAMWNLISKVATAVTSILTPGWLRLLL